MGCRGTWCKQITELFKAADFQSEIEESWKKLPINTKSNAVVWCCFQAQFRLKTCPMLCHCETEIWKNEKLGDSSSAWRHCCCWPEVGFVWLCCTTAHNSLWISCPAFSSSAALEFWRRHSAPSNQQWPVELWKRLHSQCVNPWSWVGIVWWRRPHVSPQPKAHNWQNTCDTLGKVILILVSPCL